MTTYDTFERDLAAALEEYVDEAPTRIDARAYVHQIALANPRRTGWTRSLIVPRRYLWIALAALLAIALLAAFLVASRLNERGGGLLAFERDGDIYIADTSGPGRVVPAITNDVDFHLGQWSPDGRWLTLSSETGTYLLEAATLQLQPLALPASVPLSFISWLPDGESVLAAELGPHFGRLHVVQLDAGESRALTDVEMCMVSLSPDGHWVAAIAAGKVVVVGIDSGERREVGSFGGIGCGVTYFSGWDAPTWSHDSQEIAFVGPTAVTVVGRDGSGARDIVHLDGAATETSVRPVWSPDGAWIAYWQSGDLRIVSPDGSDDHVLVQGGADNHRFTWSRDSSKIEFGRPLDDAFAPRIHLESVDIRTGEVAAVAASGSYIDEFARQPVGAEISRHLPDVVTTAAPGTLDVRPAPAGPALDPSTLAGALAYDTMLGDGTCAAFRAVFDGSPLVQFPITCHQGAAPGWSPDGSIYADFDKVYEFLGTGLVRVVDHDGILLAQVDGTEPGVYGRWSPGGQWLWLRVCLPASNSGGADLAGRAGGSCDPTRETPAYYIFRPDGSGLRQVDGEPSWSPGDATLALATADGRLLVGPSDGTDPRSVGSLPLPQAWQPASARFAYVTQSEVWTVNVDGTDATKLIDFPLGANPAHLSWSPDDSQLAVINGNVIWIVPVGGGEPTRIRLADLRPTSVTWSMDGTRLAIEAAGAAPATSGSRQVVLLDLASRSAVLVANASTPVWSPDGTALAVASYGASGEPIGIDLLRSDGSGRARAAAAAELVGVPRWLSAGF